MSESRSTLILLAAGKGTRMGSGVRKQYMELCGYPLLSWPLATFLTSPVITDIVLVIPEDDEAYIRDVILPAAVSIAEKKGACAQQPVAPSENLIREERLAGKLRAMVPGGKERYDSVYRGLQAIDWPCDYVFIHDGARPLIDEASLERLYDAVMQEGTAVAAMPSKDTVKIADATGHVLDTPDRSSVWIIQTPQVFSHAIIREAYARMMERMDELAAAGVRITDDAMAVEQMLRRRVRLVEASYSNIKVTTPEDILIAQVLMGRET